MVDGRKSRWIAWDAYFLDSPLGLAVFDRFGAVGVALFAGFLSGCKKNHIQGEISFASDVEALNLMGLPGLHLVNNEGQPFELSDFWRCLGEHHTTRQRRRGRVLTVTSTKWDKWQKGYGRETDAERKRRSRTGNAADEPQTETADTPPIGVTDSDPDLDPDLAAAAAASPTDILKAASRILAERKAEKRNPDNRGEYIAATAAGKFKDYESDAMRLLAAGEAWTPEQLADALEPAPRAKPKIADCPLCGDPLDSNHTEVWCRSHRKEQAS